MWLKISIGQRDFKRVKYICFLEKKIQNNEMERTLISVLK